MPTKNLGTKKIPHLIKRNAYTYNKMKTIIIITINKKGVLVRSLRVSLFLLFFLLSTYFSCWFQKCNLFLAAKSSFLSCENNISDRP